MVTKMTQKQEHFLKESLIKIKLYLGTDYKTLAMRAKSSTRKSTNQEITLTKSKITNWKAQGEQEGWRQKAQRFGVNAEVG